MPAFVYLGPGRGGAAGETTKTSDVYTPRLGPGTSQIKRSAEGESSFLCLQDCAVHRLCARRELYSGSVNAMFTCLRGVF